MMTTKLQFKKKLFERKLNDYSRTFIRSCKREDRDFVLKTIGKIELLDQLIKEENIQ